MVRGWVLVHCGQFGESWLLPATEVQKIFFLGENSGRYSNEPVIV
jgi:hypothetical protein